MTDGNDRARTEMLGGDPIGSFYTWWRGDALPWLPVHDDLTAGPASRLAGVAALSGLSPDELQARGDAGHRVYEALLGGETVAYGWVATRTASIPAVGATLRLPPANLYLWDFVTASPVRGRSIYPHLLQAIVRHEESTERFWIGHDRENTASARGILKAGFSDLGAIYGVPGGGVGLRPRGSPERAQAAATLLGVGLLDGTFPA